MRLKRKHAHVALAGVLILIGLMIIPSFILAQGDTWVEKAPMPTARSLLSTSVVDGKIYAIGGRANKSNVEEYDVATNIWTIKASMPTGRQWLSTSAVNGRIYAIGGTASDIKPGLATVEAYDPATNTWAEKAPMPTARFGLSTSVVDGVIYAIGGMIRTTTGGDEKSISTVEAYDPTTDTWTKKADMPSIRFALSTSVVDGKIYAIGGGVRPGVGGLATMEMYDPVTDTWTTKAPMPTGKATFLATSAVNGVIYVVGGFIGHTAYATVEAYDSSSDSWTEKSSLPAARGFLSTSVVNGKVYAIGGAPSNLLGALSTVEEYTPSGVTSVDGLSGELNNPNEFVLYQNYPNPFNPATVITYQLSAASNIELAIYNHLGQKIRTLVHARQFGGYHTIKWDGRDDSRRRVASGVYLYRLKLSRRLVQIRKMVLMQ